MTRTSCGVATATLLVALLAAAAPGAVQAQGLADLASLITQPFENPVFDPPAWKPITVLNYATYLPGLKDWASVISACKAVGKRERRLLNMFIRVAFHDAMAVDLEACKEGNTGDCHGADSSILLSVEEMLRPENGHDDLSQKIRNVTLDIATFYGVSVSDTLAVCSAVAVEVLSGGRVKFFGGKTGHEKTFRVGRLDWVPGESSQTPPDTLPAGDISVPNFAAFWEKHNLTLEEGVALMGSHSILELQDCRTDPQPDAFCDPFTDDECKDQLRMFKWDTHYYYDLCTPSITVIPGEEPPPEKDVQDMTDAEYKAEQRRAVCHWTSKTERALRLVELEQQRNGTFVEGGVPDKEIPPYNILWTNEGCEDGPDPAYCPHTVIPDDEAAFYTVNDYFLGAACGNKSAAGVYKDVQTYMKKFLNTTAWDVVFTRAFNKVLTTYANWPFINDLTDTPTLISGKECKVWVYDKKCTPSNVIPGVDIPVLDDAAAALRCTGCKTFKLGSTCDECCRCNTGFSAEGIALQGRALLPDWVLPNLPSSPDIPDIPGMPAL